MTTLDGQEALPAPASAEAGASRIERRGVDYVPQLERRSQPRNLAWAFFGPQFGFGNMFFGSLAITIGLGWWSAVTAITVGVALGSALFGAVAIIAPRTGTNNATSSTAVFGVAGRHLGSLLSVFITVGFTAILVWTSGQTVLVVLHRLLGTGTGNGPLAIAMAVVSLISFVLAIYGHDTLVVAFKAIAISALVVCVVAVPVLGGSFHAVHGGHYELGGFWPTWALGVVVAASLPVSWGVVVGDYGRYIPQTASPWSCAGWAFGGIFAGSWISLVIGAYATTTFADPGTLLATGFPTVAPLWLAILLMLTAGGASNIESAAMSVYNAALDLQSMLWRFTRTQWTLVTSILALAISLVTLVIFNAIESVEAFSTILLATTTPWLVVMVIAHLRRRGRYYTLDIQAFHIPRAKGAYWYWGGVNPRAFIAWGAGAAIGLLFTETSLFTGPLPKHVSGIDLSFSSAAVTAAVVYLALVTIFPERGVDPGEQVESETAEERVPLGMAE